MSIDIMPISYPQAILLGLLQGVTEFLPVSSTAHMAIAPQLLFHMDDPGAAFSAVVQLGPIVAIIAYFRNDLVKYLRAVWRTRTPFGLAASDLNARLGWYTILGTLPLAISGLLLEKHIDTAFRRLDIIAFSLIALALVLWYAERVGKRNRDLKQMTLAEGLTIGWAQVLSLMPGTSRSGVTITAGLLQGLDRESAARFSFLLSIPAITAAGLYKLVKVLHQSHLGPAAGPYLVAMLVAGGFAYVVVRWLLGYVKEHNLAPFIVYRIALGVLLLVMLHFGYIKDTHAAAPALEHPTAALTQQPLGTVGARVVK